jgi:DNA-binding transcriptional regulator YbjK
MRGAARRSALVEAAIALIGHHGLGAVTHRSVAAAAGVPAATTGYYFASKDQLVDEALRTLAARELEDLHRRQAALDGAPALEAIADALAAWITERVTAAGASALAQRQLWLEAVRRPELRPHAEIERAIDALAETALRALGAPDPATAAVLIVSAVDGLELRLLASAGGVVDEHELGTTLRTLLRGLTTMHAVVER